MTKRNVLKQEADRARSQLTRLGMDTSDLDLMPDTAVRVIASIVDIELTLLETEQERRTFEHSLPEMLSGVIGTAAATTQYQTTPTKMLAALFDEVSGTDYWNPIIRRLASALADSLQTSVEIGDAARKSSASAAVARR